MEAIREKEERSSASDSSSRSYLNTDNSEDEDDCEIVKVQNEIEITNDVQKGQVDLGIGERIESQSSFSSSTETESEENVATSEIKVDEFELTHSASAKNVFARHTQAPGDSLLDALLDIDETNEFAKLDILDLDVSPEQKRQQSANPMKKLLTFVSPSLKLQKTQSVMVETNKKKKVQRTDSQRMNQLVSAQLLEAKLLPKP